MFSSEKTTTVEDFVQISRNTSFQKHETHCKVSLILSGISDKKKKKSVELIIKNDIRKVTGSKHWDVYPYEMHDTVICMLQDGLEFYESMGANAIDLNFKITLPSYKDVRANHKDWMMPKELAFSLGISVQACSAKINSLNIKTNKRLAIVYMAELDVGRRVSWLYNPVIIKMMCS